MSYLYVKWNSLRCGSLVDGPKLELDLCFAGRY